LILKDKISVWESNVEWESKSLHPDHTPTSESV